MYDPTIRVSFVDCASLILWLTSIALFARLAASGSEATFAVGAVLTSIGAAAMWVTSIIRRVEHRVSDQMTIEHRAQSGEPPTILSSVR